MNIEINIFNSKKVRFRVVVIGLGCGAGDLSSNPADGLSTYIKVYVDMCTVDVNNGIFMYLCMLV